MAGSLLAQTPEPITGEFALNTFASAFPDEIALTAAGDHFLAAWTDSALSDLTADTVDIFVRGISLTGTTSEAFRANPFRNDACQRPSIAARASGEFLVSYEIPGDSAEIRARTFTTTLRPRNGEVALNTQTVGVQAISTAAAMPDGRWIVAWIDANSGANRVVGRFVDSEGNPQGAEIPISTSANFNGAIVHLAVDATGNFAAAWGSDGDDGNGNAAVLRIFSPSGSPLTAQLIGNDFTTGSQTAGDLEFLADGTLLLAIVGPTSDGSQEISQQRFSLAGAKIGPQETVNEFKDSSQIQPCVVPVADGGWLVLWMSFGQDGSGFGIVGRRFDASGNRIGEEFLVNEIIGGSQSRPAGAVIGDVLAVAWESEEGISSADDTVPFRLFRVPSTDDVPPTVTITGGKRITTARSRAVIRGTAADDVEVSSVLASVNRGPFKPVKGVSPWKFATGLTDGKNLVRVKAVDSNGNESRSQTVRITRVLR